MVTKKTVNKKADKIVKEVKTLCTNLFKDKLCDVYLYGSYARGDYNKYSDIDILVTADISDVELMKYRKIFSDFTHELTWNYDVMVSVIMVPVRRFVRFEKILPFYRNVTSEGIRYGA